MAERLADIESLIRNVRQLRSVVTAMRSIAASRAQQGRSLLSGIEAFSSTIARAIANAMELMPHEEPARHTKRQEKRAIILFCAEQGFAGAFSERVLAAAGNLEGVSVLLVGTRGAALVGESGVNPVWSAPMATHVGTIPTFANKLAEELYATMAAVPLTRVEIVFCCAAAGGAIEATRRSLLPLDPRAFALPSRTQPPLTTLPPSILLERLAAEYVYAQLCKAATQAFVAENEARMRAMTWARTNIEKRLSALIQRERLLRQEEITTEIVELAAGADALLKAAE